MNKRQKRNRKIIKIITSILIFLQFVISVGIGGNLDTDTPITAKIKIIYIIVTILTFIFLKLCEKLEN